MLAMAISLLIGVAAAIAIQVTCVSARRALRAYSRLAGELAGLEAGASVQRLRTIPAVSRPRSQPRYAAA
jgi:hypothetical protein